jgi:formylglycine-generating enzyme required for sulfatase activity
MKPYTPSSRSVANFLGVVALAGWFVVAPWPSRGQSPAPAAAPATTKVLRADPMTVPPPPLTAAQQAVLKGGPADLVARFAKDTGITLVPVPAGSFTMGSPASEAGRTSDEGPPTKVTLTKDFFLGATAVTQAQWTAVMGHTVSMSSAEEAGNNRAREEWPVTLMTWENAMEFCRKLTAREQAAGALPAGYALTLPTEAQREYACRAGATDAYAGVLDDIAWYDKNSGGLKHAVGTKQPNAWGLYDMEGNVWEWCSDWYGRYPGGMATDPTGPAVGEPQTVYRMVERVVRGGSWDFDARTCRSANRIGEPPEGHTFEVGFRVALSVPVKPH